MNAAEIDAFLDGLGEEARAAARVLVARAYERGFREGLSSAGASPLVRPPPVVPVPVAVPEPAATVAWDEAEPAEPDEDEDGRAEAEPARPIAVRATVGTLMRRIERTFALERFDVEVVVCRRGDRDRRQLKANVRLKNYLRER